MNEGRDAARPAAAAEAAPIAAAEAASLLAVLSGARCVLLAVSGGPDSVAMMRLAVASAGSLPPLAVASVDHGLSDGSRTIAEDVVATAARLGLAARVLTWDGANGGSRLQERARAARYALLVAEARRVGASHLATAHTCDDQAETVLFRLARGSGLEGLRGMHPARDRDGIVHLRPFLDIPKARLVATCRAGGWPFVSDPANADPRFARARLRRLLPGLAAEGLTAAGLARLARRCGEADDAILAMARRILAEAAVAPDLYRAAPFLDAPLAIRRRALGLALSDRVRPGAPRLERLELYVAALDAALEAHRPLRRTLHGVLLAYDGDDRLALFPEPPRQPRRPLG